MQSLYIVKCTQQKTDYNTLAKNGQPWHNTRNRQLLQYVGKKSYQDIMLATNGKLWQYLGYKQAMLKYMGNKWVIVTMHWGQMGNCDHTLAKNG